MSYLYYVAPIVLAGGSIAFSKWYAQRAMKAAQNLSPEEAAQRFHDAYAHYFDVEEQERIVGAWSGVVFTGARSTARKLAGAALNQASAALIGVSTYVPRVFVGLTSLGRLLVALEHSEMGSRDHFRQVRAYPQGVRVLDAQQAAPGEDLGAAPKEANGMGGTLEFIQLSHPNGVVFEAWLSRHGARVGHAGFCSIKEVLG